MTEKIGFIGLGTMGKPMARNKMWYNARTTKREDVTGHSPSP